MSAGVAGVGKVSSYIIIFNASMCDFERPDPVLLCTFVFGKLILPNWHIDAVRWERSIPLLERGKISGIVSISRGRTEPSLSM